MVAQHGEMTFEYLGPLTPPQAVVRCNCTAPTLHRASEPPGSECSKTPVEMSPEGLQWRTIQTVIDGD